MPLLKEYQQPWAITNDMKAIIEKLIPMLSKGDYHINGHVAIHKKAVVEEHVVLKDHIIIEEGSIIKSGSYIRVGVYIGKGVSVGANCEIKQSLIFKDSRIAHLNYVGNSIIGEDVNLEAGAVLANHFNEREDKNIVVLIDGRRVSTGATKFGSLLGDHCRIGANAVLNPGTILDSHSIVERLTHVNQLK
jgi:NDP-sugar pyrophosphorylase family protein